MAITGPSSYVPTTLSFRNHWRTTNTELGAAGPLLTEEGKTEADLSALYDLLVGFSESIQDKLNDTEIARGSIDILKTSLVARLSAFNRRVRGSLGKSAFARALPDVPSINAGASNILKPLSDMKSLWGKINGATIPGFTPPLLLPDDNYAVAAFLTDLAALKTAYETDQDAEFVLQFEREQRNVVQDQAYAIMRDYRAAVLGAFPPEHALIASLPLLTPLPGSTPAVVTASGQWVAQPGYAVITWTESTDPNLYQYEIRMTPGPNYDTDSDTVIGNVQPGTLSFQTLAGLSTPGTTASYKVYLILTTGNESGSNTVVITRPTS